MLRILRVTALLSLVASVGCSSVVCTLVGCGDDVFVTLTGNLPGEYYAQVRVPGEEMVEFFCGPTSCRLVEIEGAPAEVELTILDSDREEIARGAFKLVYEDYHPNGPACSPVCQRATVTLNIP